MATIKSYTDLQQSKRLAEILPIESADMEYLVIKENGLLVAKVPFVKDNSEIEDSAFNQIYDTIACWSLAALLEVLPAKCECMSLEHINYGNNHKKYFMHYIGGENTEDYDNSIDACVEMILKLHELKML